MSMIPPPFTFTPGTQAQSAQVNSDFTAAYTNDTSLQTQITALAASINALPLPAQGRLTLTSGVPVLSANVTNAGTVYYTPYIGQGVPIYNGTATEVFTFAEQGCVLDTSSHLSGNLYDVFARQVAGGVFIGTGPAWSSGTARSAPISRLNGFLTNTNNINLINNSVTTAVLANQATYLGTIYCNGNAQVSMTMNPTAASGGTNNILGVYNAFNRVRTGALCLDSSTPWAASSGSTWQTLNGSTSNRITFVDGLQSSVIEGVMASVADIPSSSSGNVQGAVGVNLDATTGTPTAAGAFWGVVAAQAQFGQMVGQFEFLPQLGLHFVQGMQFSNSTSATVYQFQGKSATLGQLTSLKLLIDL